MFLFIFKLCSNGWGQCDPNYTEWGLIPVPAAGYTQYATLWDAFVGDYNETSSELIGGVEYTYAIDDETETWVVVRTDDDSFIAQGWAPITFTATNNIYCVDSICKMIKIAPFWAYYIPNTFTPDNKDGVNDGWGIIGQGILDKDFELIVFNRWGEQVWESSHPQKYWKGETYSGLQVPKGVYAFRATFFTADGKQRLEIGHISVLDSY